MDMYLIGVYVALACLIFLFWLQDKRCGRIEARLSKVELALDELGVGETEAK